MSGWRLGNLGARKKKLCRTILFWEGFMGREREVGDNF